MMFLWELKEEDRKGTKVHFIEKDMRNFYFEAMDPSDEKKFVPEKKYASDTPLKKIFERGMRASNRNYELYKNFWTYEIVVDEHRLRKFKVSDSYHVDLCGYENRYCHLAPSGMSHFSKNFLYKYDFITSYRF